MEKRIGVSGNSLKILAVVCMFVDHFTYNMWNSVLFNAIADRGMDPMLIYYIGRSIGRISMPIFLYMVSVGYEKTSNKKKFLSRMIIFAIIAEPCFDLGLFRTIYYPEYQSVMLTFSLAVGGLYLGELVYDRLSKSNNKNIGTVLRCVVYAATVYLSYLLHVDYGIYPAITLILAHHFKDKRIFMLLLGVLGYCSYKVFVLHEVPICFFELVSVGILLFYNGKRGRGSKYFFYVFYPAHLLALYYVFYI